MSYQANLFNDSSVKTCGPATLTEPDDEVALDLPAFTETVNEVDWLTGTLVRSNLAES